jgi:hypothetical protein
MLFYYLIVTELQDLSFVHKGPRSSSLLTYVHNLQQTNHVILCNSTVSSPLEIIL